MSIVALVAILGPNRVPGQVQAARNPDAENRQTRRRKIRANWDVCEGS